MMSPLWRSPIIHKPRLNRILAQFFSRNYTISAILEEFSLAWTTSKRKGFGIKWYGWLALLFGVEKIYCKFFFLKLLVPEYFCTTPLTLSVLSKKIIGKNGWADKSCSSHLIYSTIAQATVSDGALVSSCWIHCDIKPDSKHELTPGSDQSS